MKYRLEFILRYTIGNFTKSSTSTLLNEDLYKLLIDGNYFYKFIIKEYKSLGFIEDDSKNNYTFNLLIVLKDVDINDKKLNIIVNENAIQFLCEEFSKLSSTKKLEYVLPFIDQALKIVGYDELDFDQTDESILIHKFYKYNKYKKRIINSAHIAILERYKLNVESLIQEFI